MSTTDPHGRYAVKTDWEPTKLVVSAPGYVTTTVAVPDTDQVPVVNVDLERSMPAAGGPLVGQMDQSGLPSGTSAGVDARAAPKLQELQSLHDRGLISDAEYKRTRNRIIEGL